MIVTIILTDPVFVALLVYVVLLATRASQCSVSARLDVERSTVAACGVSVSLVIPSAGVDAQKGWRRFLHGTLEPVAVWSARS